MSYNDPATADADVDTRAVYLGDERMPLLYVSTPPGDHDDTLISRVTLAVGLPRFRRDRPIRAAGPGWYMQIDRTGVGDPAPLLAIAWAGPREHFVYGVRKTSPIGWADDAVEVRQAVLITGPPLDWERLIAVSVPDSAAGGIVLAGDLLDALDGRLATAGIMAVVDRKSTQFW